MPRRQPEDVPGYRSELSDRELGMDRPITRRDFLDGVAIAVGALSVGGMGASTALAGERGGRGPYPPELTGLRGPIPGDVASRPFGRIAVACSDAVYHGFGDGSIEAAYRAVGELARA